MSSDSYWKNLDVNYEPKELINADNSSKDIIIIDDLFDDPDAVREQLLGLSYEPHLIQNSGSFLSMQLYQIIYTKRLIQK